MNTRTKPATFGMLLLASLTSCWGSIIYSVDTGSYHTSLGLTPGGTLTVANAFTVAAGGELISEVRVYWDGSALPVGSPLTLFLWSDPNGDGSPSDATILTSLPVFSTSGWATYPLTPVYVGSPGSNFFAGFSITHSQGQFPVALDFGPSANATWLSVSADVQEALLLSQHTFNFNAMIRAVGGELTGGEIPEPSALLLVATGLAGAWRQGRRGRKTG